MNLSKLKERQFDGNPSLSDQYTQLTALLAALDGKELPENMIEFIDQEVETVNESTVTDKEFKKFLRQKQKKVLSHVEKELKIVPKNYYRNLWLVLGMTTFGLPIGMAIGFSTGNMAFLAIGLPIGMAIGIAVGARMDKKAWEDGRQLPIELKN